MEQQKRWYEKKNAAHPEKLAECREMNRIAERVRREQKKAERLVAQANV